MHLSTSSRTTSIARSSARGRSSGAQITRQQRRINGRVCCAAATATTVEVGKAGSPEGAAVSLALAEPMTLGTVLSDGSVLFTAELLRSVVVRLPVPGAPPSLASPPATPQTQAPQAAPAPAPPSAQVAAPASAPAAAAPVSDTMEELSRRRRWRVMREIVEAAERSNQRGRVRKGFRPVYDKAPAAGAGAAKYDPERIMAGLAQLETLVPGFQPNLEAMAADKWAELALDIQSVGARLVALKTEWPAMDLTAMLLKYPKALLMTPEQIKADAAQVRELLKTAKDPDAIVQAVPQMLTPQVAASVLVTINKWWQFKRDPVEVLESDPSLVLRAQEMDQPFEPVYQATDGSWVVPGANKAKRPEWAQQIVDHAAKQKARQQPQQQARAQAQAQAQAAQAAAAEAQQQQQQQAPPPSPDGSAAVAAA